jgi:general secretion pathway protein D
MSPRRAATGRPLAAALILALLAGACGASRAYRQGQKFAKQGNWDLAVARLTVALQKSPDNIGYKIALENARIQASRFHYAEARRHLAADQLERAAEELEIATKYDPGNKSAADDLALVRDKIRGREEERRRLAEFEAMKTRAQAAPVPLPVLSPRSQAPITLKFSDTSVQKILDTLAKLAGVNILFDEGYRDKKADVNLTGVTFQEALDQITFVNRLFYKVIDQNTLIVVPESPQKRRSYDDLILRTFYLQNAEVNETLNLVKTLAGIQKAAGNPSAGAITVLDTPDKVALAARVIELNDKAKGEVMVEVQILEVNRNKVKDYGLRLSNYGASLTYSPFGGDEASVGGDSPTGFTSVRAHLLSSLSLADFVVSIPAQVFARFLQSDATTRILASPRLRAAEGKKTTLKIGQDVPVPITTFQATQTGGTTFTPATSFQYRTVGVTLDLTPKVNASGDISLELNAEFSLLGQAADVGGQENLPTFLTRTVSGILRLRDGETSLIGGLVQSRETASFTGIFGLQSVPILNKLFTSTNKQSEESEVLLSITPHLVRAPKLTEDDLKALYVGTQELPRVAGARPPLFGPEEPEPSPSPGPLPGRPAPPAPAAPSPPPSPTPPSPTPPATPELEPSPGPLPMAPPPEAAAAGETTVPVPPSPIRQASAVRALFSPPEISVKAGETGSMGLVVMGVRELLSAEVVLTYDPSMLELADVMAGSLLTVDGAPVGAERAMEAGRVRARFTRAEGTSGSGAVVAVTMKGLRAGPAAVAAESLTLVTAAGTERPATPVPGRIVVTP